MKNLFIFDAIYVDRYIEIFGMSLNVIENSISARFNCRVMRIQRFSVHITLARYRAITTMRNTHYLSNVR